MIYLRVEPEREMQGDFSKFAKLDWQPTIHGDERLSYATDKELFQVFADYHT